jgi:cell division protein FtsZ
MAIRVDSIKSNPIHTGLPVIKVIGVGGGGGNVVNRMIKDDVKGVQYISINTDGMALKSSRADITLPIGTKITGGLGAGMKPEIGRAAAIEQIDTIKHLLEDADMVFLAAGMGGGTGTGAAPVLAEVAKEMKILTVAVVTIPFSFEGPKRSRLAHTGIDELRKHIDTLVVVPNTRLLELASPKTTMSEAFAMADNVLKQAISGITNLINFEGFINLDFADLQTVMRNKGNAYMGTGSGTGDNRGLKAVKKALVSPLITQPIDGATGVIINIVADRDFPLLDAQASAEYVQNSAHPDADVIFGLVYDPSLVDKVTVTVIATGYGNDPRTGAAEKVERTPLRVTDSLKAKNLPPGTEIRPKSTSRKTDTEEIEVPHFMRRNKV